jgi:hypothetical protein
MPMSVLCRWATRGISRLTSEQGHRIPHEAIVADTILPSAITTVA